MNRTPNSAIIVRIQGAKLRNVANVNNSRNNSSGNSRNLSSSTDGLRWARAELRLVNVIETQKMEPEKENAELQ